MHMRYVLCVYVWRYVVHVLITHARGQIDTVKIVSVIAHRTTPPKGRDLCSLVQGPGDEARVFEAQVDIEREEVGDQYTSNKPRLQYQWQ